MNTIIVSKPSFKIFTEDLLLLKTEKIHIVCPALIKASYCMYYLADSMRMNINDVIKLCERVEAAKEPGCLYPRFNFTIFPTHASGADLMASMEEVMVAQEQYFKTDKMLFAFDQNAWPDLAVVKNALQHKINDWEESGKIKYLKSCYFFE
jgi:hypothetical protein